MPFTHPRKAMKLNRKQTIVGAAVLIALAGGSYGAYTYISGLPKRLNKEEAAKRYLEIVCPGNALNPEIITISTKGKALNDEIQFIHGRTYYGEAALAEAQRRQDALEKEYATQSKKYNLILAKKRELNRQEAKMFSDPDYVWPDDVKDEIKQAAAARMENASDITDYLSGVSKEGGDDNNQVFSTIRLRLGLTERGTGCPKDAAKAKKG